jgi:hypothetical protein
VTLLVKAKRRLSMKFRRKYANRLKEYGLDSDSQPESIPQEYAQVEINQVYGYEPARVFLLGCETRFYCICEFISTATRYISEISGYLDWSSEPCWCLVPNGTVSAAQFGAMKGDELTSLFSMFNEPVTIPCRRPTRLVLIGTAQRILPAVPVRDNQNVLIEFAFSDGESLETSFDFTLMKTFVRSKASAQGVSFSTNGSVANASQADSEEGDVE